MMAGQHCTFTARNRMKKDSTSTTAAAKAAREPRISCYQTLYSSAALAIMDAATGQRTTQLMPATPKVPVQAKDAD